MTSAGLLTHTFFALLYPTVTCPHSHTASLCLLETPVSHTQLCPLDTTSSKYPVAGLFRNQHKHVHCSHLILVLSYTHMHTGLLASAVMCIHMPTAPISPLKAPAFTSLLHLWHLQELAITCLMPPFSSICTCILMPNAHLWSLQASTPAYPLCHSSLCRNMYSCDHYPSVASAGSYMHKNCGSHWHLQVKALMLTGPSVFCRHMYSHA